MSEWYAYGSSSKERLCDALQLDIDEFDSINISYQSVVCNEALKDRNVEAVSRYFLSVNKNKNFCNS